MTAQNLLTQGVNRVTRERDSRCNKKPTAEGDISFGQIMTQNIGNQKNNAVDSQLAGSNKKTKDNNTKSANILKEEKPKSVRETNTKKPKVTAEDKVSKEETEKKIPEDLLSKVQAMILGAAAKALDITPEELNAAMNELNLEPFDLLDTSNLTKLVMGVNGADDPMALLTDENLSADLKNLTDAMNQINLTDDASLTKEAITAWQTDAKDKMPDQNQGLVTEAVAEETITSGKENASQTNRSSTENSEESKEISITVTKEGKTLTTQKEEANGQNFQDNHSSKQQDNPQTPVETFVNNLAAKGQTQNVNTEVQTQKVEMMRNIVEQVVDQIKVNIKPETTSMEMQLNPQNLGKINLSVASKDGHLTATLTTQNEMAREALESQMQILKDNLNNQGLKVEAVEVNVSEFAFDSKQNSQTENGENKSRNQKKRNIDLKSFNAAAEATEEEVLIAKVMEQNGGSVDYTA